MKNSIKKIKKKTILGAQNAFKSPLTILVYYGREGEHQNLKWKYLYIYVGRLFCAPNNSFSSFYC